MMRRRKNLPPLLALSLALAALLLLLRVVSAASNGQTRPDSPDAGPQVSCIVWPENAPHPSWNGNRVTLKALVHSTGDNLSYRWDFADGATSASKPVSDKYVISATHVYTGWPDGARLNATLTVTDNDSGLSAMDVYPIRMQQPTTDAQLKQAIADGLWYLHSAMERSQIDGAPVGYWPGYEADVGYAGMAVLAFELQGYFPSGASAYAETVQRGINFLLSRTYSQTIVSQPAGDPDSNGNGLGLVCETRNGNKIYEAAIALLALSNSNTPSQTAALGSTCIISQTWRGVAQDMADWLAYAQNEDNTVGGRGGWRRDANYSNSTTTTSSWPVLALQSAEVNWGIAVPDWVKTELGDYFLAFIQGEDGGFGYDAPGVGNVVRTGGGLAGLAFVGAPATDPRVISATRFISNNWPIDNLGNFYTMYWVANGSRLSAPEIQAFAGHDWYTEYAQRLIAAQYPDGRWQDTGPWGEAPIDTAWAISILTPRLFVRESDLAVSQTAQPDPALVDQPLVYHITVNNLGLFEATNIVISDTLPANAVFDSATSSQGDCARQGALSPPYFTCHLGNLSGAGSLTLAITVTPTASGALSNTVWITASQPDANTHNNLAVSSLLVITNWRSTFLPTILKEAKDEN